MKRNFQSTLRKDDKALELDPQYEPAMVNKAMTETLAEGEKMDNKVKTVEYYKDFPIRFPDSLSNKCIFCGGTIRGKIVFLLKC